MPEISSKQDKILHIDDSIDFLNLFSRLFGQHFDIVSAKSGLEALDLLISGPFDAIITDFELPGLNGLEILDIVRNKYPNTPVIFYTGQGNEKIAREAFIRGASDYFSKDIFGFAHKEKFLFSIKRAIENSRARRAVEETQERLRAVIETAKDPIFIKDKDLKFIVVNPAFEVLAEKNEKEIIGKEYEDIFSNLVKPDVIERNRIYDAATLEGNITEDNVVKHTETGDRYYHTIKVPLKDSTGKIIGVCGIARDITQVKAIEDALKRSEEKYRLLVDSSSDLVYTVDIEGTIQHLSAAISKFGYSSDELIGKSFFNLIHPEDIEHVLNNFKIFLSNGVSFPDEFRVITKDGSIRWVEDFGSLMYDKERNPKGQFGFLRDITYKKEAEAKMRIQEDRLRSIFNNAHIGLFRATFDGIILDINKKCYEMIGFRDEDEVREYCRESGNARDFYMFPETRNELINGAMNNPGEWISTETVFRRRDGSLFRAKIAFRIVPEEHGIVEGYLEDITEMREAESKLRQSEEKFRTLVENLSEIIMRFDRQHRHLFVNQAILNTLNIPPEDFIGKTHAEMGFPEDLCRFWEECIEKVFVSGEPVETEFEFEGLDGPRTVDFRLYPEFDSDRNVVTVLSVSRDITLKKKADETLRYNEQALQLALQGADLGMWDWSLETGKVIFSKRYYEIIGYEENEFEAGPENWKNLLHPDDAERVLKVLQDNFDGIMQCFEIEYRMKSKQGNWVWVQSRGRVLYRDPEGRPLRIAGTHLDITQRKKTENTLFETDKRYQMLARNSNDVIWTMNLEGVFTYLSPSVENLRGYKAEELLGTSFLDSLCPSSVAEAEVGVSLLKDEIVKGVKAPVRYYELEQPCKDGSTVWIETTAWVMYDEIGTPVEIVGITRNIDQRKKTESQLLAINKELDDFTFMVSHDLKSPINIIKAYLGAISEEQELFGDLFPKCVEQADKVFNYIDDLLQLSRAGRVIQEKQVFNIGFLFRMLMGNYKHHQSCDCFVQDNFPEVYGDLAGIETIFANLFENSFRYRDPSREKLIININWKKKDKSVVIIFSDNGKGVEPDELSKIFMPGYSTGSTGFGLAIVKKIVEAHHGRIWAESEGEGKGLTFFIELPDFNPAA
ncbi:MAG: PAS domain S-box protein [Firmicutes bacterium]|nr:PAS domain S-box protein [Bacillota bacterium]